MSTADNTKPPKTRTTNTKHTRVESGDQEERERERERDARGARRLSGTSKP